MAPRWAYFCNGGCLIAAIWSADTGMPGACLLSCLMGAMYWWLAGKMKDDA